MGDLQWSKKGAARDNSVTVPCGLNDRWGPVPLHLSQPQTEEHLGWKQSAEHWAGAAGAEIMYILPAGSPWRTAGWVHSLTKILINTLGLPGSVLFSPCSSGILGGF